MAKLETIEGIGLVYAEKLRAAGIGTVEALLRAGATPEVAGNWQKGPGSVTSTSWTGSTGPI